MRKTLILALVISATAGAQDGAKRSVEQPLKHGIAPRPEKFDLAAGGIDWHQGLDSVLNQGKPILLFQLLGNFDDVYC
jgi:hypothetical protein